MVTKKSSGICKRLVLLLDGTWNLDDEDGPATNIVRMRESLSKGLLKRFTGVIKQRNGNKAAALVYKTVDTAFDKEGASGIVCDGFEYLVYYDQGVGTGALRDRLSGGLTGEGLDQNVRQAYKFLSYHFRPGDEIFIFGFSRGAFTARTLCGYLHAFGLLKRDHCTKINEETAWEYYRTPPHDRLSGEWRKSQPSPNNSNDGLVYDRRLLRVRCLGVFDTVGALGIPFFYRVNKTRYQFHDTSVNSLIDIRLHAVAIDEWRLSFEATLWRKPKFQIFDGRDTPTEQVWFAGAHGDVGGGYAYWERKEKGLADIPALWMMQRVNFHLRQSAPVGQRMHDRRADARAYSITPDRKAPLPFGINDDDCKAQAAGMQHRPWWLLLSYFPPSCRLINQHIPSDKRGIRIKGKMVHQDPIGEMVHVSAVERLGKKVSVEGKFFHRSYRPRNLVAAIPDILSTYRKDGIKIPATWQDLVPETPHTPTLIVDWDGTPLAGKGGADRVQQIIKGLPAPKDLRYVAPATRGSK